MLYIRTHPRSTMAAAWPFHCPEPEVLLTQQGALQLSYWRESSADLNQMPPLNRAVYTYATWAPSLPSSWSRNSGPTPGTMVQSELLGLNDPARYDGTCLKLPDFTVDAACTQYDSGAAAPEAAVDMQPCLATMALEGQNAWGIPPLSVMWREPNGTYPSRGWSFQFSIDHAPPNATALCSLKYGALRLPPANNGTLTVVQIGTMTGCAQEYCAVGSTPFAATASDVLLRRAGSWDVETGLPSQDVFLRPTSRVSRAVTPLTGYTSVGGIMTVADPLLWPGVTSLNVTDAGIGSNGPACTFASGPFSLNGSVWTGPFRIGCATVQSSVVEKTVLLNAAPWGVRTWMHGPLRNLTLETLPALLDTPPLVTAAPSTGASLVGLGALASVKFALWSPGADSVWEVVSLNVTGMAATLNPQIVSSPASMCTHAASAVLLYTPRVAIQSGDAYFAFSNRRAPPWDAAPARVAVCANVGVAAVRPVAGAPWPSWTSAAAASRFSSNGVTTQTVSTDGTQVLYMSSHPVWEDGIGVQGCVVAPCAAPVAGYPYRSTPASYGLQHVVSSWIGLLSTALAPGSSSGEGRSGAQFLPPIPPSPPLSQVLQTPGILPATSSDVVPATAPASGAAYALLAAAVLLLLAAVAMVVWGAALHGKRDEHHHHHHEESRKGGDDDDEQRNHERSKGAKKNHNDDEAEGEDDEEVHKKKKKNKKISRSHTFGTRLLLIAMMPFMCAAASTVQREAACAACNGVISPTTSVCVCGWGKVESIVYSLVLFPVIAMTLLYV